MKLLLTSAGLRKDNDSDFRQGLVDSFKKLLGQEPKGLKCAYIPTAADPEEDKWFVEAGRQELKDLGMELIDVDLKDPNKASVKEKLEQSDVIYVNGGNTFYLLDWARKSGLSDYLKELLDKGIVYIGVSAGSILLGPDIAISGWDCTWDKNIVNLTDTTGLNIVPFATSPHFTETERPVLEKKMREANYPVIAITDEQAVLVDGDNQEIVGEGEKITLHASN